MPSQPLIAGPTANGPLGLRSVNSSQPRNHSTTSAPGSSNLPRILSLRIDLFRKSTHIMQSYRSINSGTRNISVVVVAFGHQERVVAVAYVVIELYDYGKINISKWQRCSLSSTIWQFQTEFLSRCLPMLALGSANVVYTMFRAGSRRFQNSSTVIIATGALLLVAEGDARNMFVYSCTLGIGGSRDYCRSYRLEFVCDRRISHVFLDLLQCRKWATTILYFVASLVTRFS